MDNICCRNDKCIHYFENMCLMQDKLVHLNEYGKCESFKVGLNDLYLLENDCIEKIDNE